MTESLPVCSSSEAGRGWIKFGPEHESLAVIVSWERGQGTGVDLFSLQVPYRVS